MNMSDRIQYLRKTKGISQEELADKVGVSRQAVSKWENGTSDPNTTNLIALSRLYKVTPEDLLKCIQEKSLSNE